MSNYYQDESPYQSGFSLPSITWAVRLVMIGTIGIFAVQLVLHVPFGEFPAETPGGNPVWWFSFQPKFWFLIWKPFSYQLLHSGLSHLFFNMMWLYFFGPEVERALGSRGFLKFYFICGAAAVLLNLIPYAIGSLPGDVPIVGASGSIMALLIAFAMLNPDRQFFLFPLPFPITSRMLVIIVIVVNLFQSTGNNNISVATHFGGMAAGFLYMKFLPLALARYREYVIARAPKKSDPDKVGEAVDNIFNLKDWKKK